MRLQSQLGAHPSRLVGNKKAQTGRSSFLPGPANSAHNGRLAASNRARVLLHRNRPIILVAVVVLGCYAVYVITWSYAPHDVDAPSYFNRFVPAMPGRAHPQSSAPKRVGGTADMPLDDLPIRIDPHPNPHIPLPRESVFDNPWPDDTKIAQHWLDDWRLANVGSASPDWALLTTGKGLDVRVPNRLPRDRMQTWEKFARTAGYKPAALEAAPAGSASDGVWSKIQLDSYSETAEDVRIRQARQAWVKRAFLHAWRGYETRAWGHDEVLPVSGRYSNPFNAWGATIVDSLSTLLLMNLTQEYSYARVHVRQIDFTTVLGERSAYGKRENSLTLPVFETTIRYLGGLLSAYDLTGGEDTLMLERAEELAGWLMGAFDTRYGLPLGKYELGSSVAGKYAGPQVLSEVGSFSLEFGRLAQITSKTEYYDVVARAREYLEKKSAAAKYPGLLGGEVDDSAGTVKGTIGFGGQSDSYYEYQLKAALLFRNATVAPEYLRSFEAAIDSAHASHLVSPVAVVPGEENRDLTIFGQIKFGTYWPVLEHLACFAGGLVGLGSRVRTGNARDRDLRTGELVTQTCFWSYNSTWTGLGAETQTFHHPQDIRRFSVATDEETGETYRKVAGSPNGQLKADRKFSSRPETIESIYYMWWLTGDASWQEKGWAMFTNWVRHTVVPFGFSGVNNVNSPNHRHVDSMESYVLAETLKYYYLLFADPHFLSLDEYVFNTEGHPLRLPLPAGQAASSSFTPTWRPSKLDEELTERYSDPLEQDRNVVGRGTFVQQSLIKVMA